MKLTGDSLHRLLEAVVRPPRHRPLRQVDARGRGLQRPVGPAPDERQSGGAERRRRVARAAGDRESLPGRLPRPRAGPPRRGRRGRSSRRCATHLHRRHGRRHGLGPRAAGGGGGAAGLPAGRRGLLWRQLPAGRLPPAGRGALIRLAGRRGAGTTCLRRATHAGPQQGGRPCCCAAGPAGSGLRCLGRQRRRRSGQRCCSGGSGCGCCGGGVGSAGRKHEHGGSARLGDCGGGGLRWAAERRAGRHGTQSRGHPRDRAERAARAAGDRPQVLQAVRFA